MKKKRKTKQKITMKSQKTKVRRNKFQNALSEALDKSFGAKGFTEELIRSGRLTIM
jgi:hypothetical protein